MKHFALILYISLSIGVSSCTNKETLPLKFEIKLEITTKLNAQRAKGATCGVDVFKPTKSVIWNDLLEKAALNHATDMYNRQYFNHQSPEGLSAGDRSLKVG